MPHALKKIILSLLLFGLALPAQATDFCKRYPNDTALAVVTPGSISSYESDPLSLHLDQTTPQIIINGFPTFDGGWVSNTNTIQYGNSLVYADAADAYTIRDTSLSSNYSQLGLGVNVAGGYAYIQSKKHDSGTELPLTFWSNVAERMRINTDGTIKLNQYATDGFVKFTGSTGTLGVDTSTYLTSLTGAWLTATAQTGLTGDKSGSFNLTTSGFYNSTDAAVTFSKTAFNTTTVANANDLYLTGGYFVTSGLAGKTGNSLIGVEGITYPESTTDTAISFKSTIGDGSGVTDPTTEEICFYANHTTSGTDANLKKWAFYNATSDNGSYVGGKVFLGGDNHKTYWGGGLDAAIWYNGTDLYIDPKQVGSGVLNLNGGNLTTTGTLGAEAITGTSFIIGANTLNTSEWAYLDGQDQAVKTTSSPTFNALTVTTTINNGTLLSDTTDMSLRVGFQAGLNVVSGAIQGMYLGYQAGLASATLSTVAADYNIAIGYRSLYSNQSGAYDVAIGDQALQGNTTGPRNIAIGHRALYVNTSGTDNLAIGYRTLYANLTGGYNFAIGTQALYQHTAGNYNVAIGLNTLYDNLTGQQNFAAGYYAGNKCLGSLNVFIGYYGGAYETGSNTLYIDGIDRTDSAGDRTGALLYGIFNATPASQSLTTNVGNFNIADVGTVGAEKLTNGTFTGGSSSWTLGAVWFYGYAFTVSGVTTAPTAGATYTNNSVTYTVKYSVITDGAGSVFATGASDPLASGTLTKVSGTGDATIAFSAFVTNEVFKCVDGTSTLTQTSAAMVTPLIIGELYYLSYEISDWTVGTVTPSCGGVTMTASTALNGTNSGLFVATSTATLTFTPSSTARFTIDSISLKKVTGGNLNLGGNINLMGNANFGIASGVVLKQGSNGKCGTFVANGITAVTVSNTSIAITDVIMISLNTVGGTVGAQPVVTTITASTGFTVVCTALDTSTYNYVIISNTP